MNTLTIKDLYVIEELDDKTMSAVRGGILGGCADCGHVRPGQTYGEAFNTILCQVTAITNGGHPC